MNKPLAVRIETSNSQYDPSDVLYEDIPLPPIETWPKEVMEGQAPVRPAMASAAKRERETLQFRTPALNAIPLKYPFDHSTLGAVEAVTVRRLTVGEVGEILDERVGDVPDNFDIYARMTGLPAPVLRGLMDVDGEEVVNACFDFLPRFFRPRADVSSSNSASGEQS